MAERRVNISPVEILFVERSSRDAKGRRVILRLNGCENTLYQGEVLSDIDLRLWDLTHGQRREIERFLTVGGEHE